ncbi:mandelate racemase [Burkholderia sp. Bp9125]|nr:mandelate racemase [Burkholderia sp. Bp9125]
MPLSTEPTIDAARARAYRIPAERPEADGSLAWDATTLVVAEIDAGPVTGLGYTYADAGAAQLVAPLLAGALRGMPACDIPAAVDAMWRAVRNVGRSGIAACAISALDIALWDAKAKLAGAPLAVLLGRAHTRVPVYGSDGFTTYDARTLAAQLDDWRGQRVRACKIKIGEHDADDMGRLRIARDALGPDVALFVDANGAYSPRTALAFADAAAGFDIRWFEEPVSADDVDGLRFVRERVGPRVDVAAGEYAYTSDDFRRLLGARAVQRIRHVEWFHDHVRIESMLFDGAPELVDGGLEIDAARPGLGLAFRRADAERFAV